MSVSNSDLPDIISELLDEKLSVINKRLDDLEHKQNLIKGKSVFLEGNQTSSFVNMAFQTGNSGVTDTQTGNMLSRLVFSEHYIYRLLDTLSINMGEY